MKKEEDLFLHNTYETERELLNCVREGLVDEVIRYSMNIDTEIGRLADKEVDHWKNAVLVSITLCTRAAIEGGLFPEDAYSLSDFYIQKCDKCQKIPGLIAYRNQAVKDLTERVKKRQESCRTSSYVEKCKDYIRKHYREKISLNDLAKNLGINVTYLSRLFSQKEGMRLQDYINYVWIEKAANLLQYSEKSIASIGEYVNFSSQSYFGTVFKKFKKMTPGEYRERFKPVEFSTKKGSF